MYAPGIRGRTTLAACLGLLLCAIAPAFSWQDQGHKIVASIAWQQLKPPVRKKVMQILEEGKDPAFRDFVQASLWADAVKNTSRYGHDYDPARPYHYIDLPVHLAGAPNDAPTVPPAGPNVVWAINQCLRKLRDPSFHGESPLLDSQDAALRFLIHFVGDIHQPLHTVSAFSSAHPMGDDGGNKFGISLEEGGRLVSPVTDASGDKVRPNLHYFWDIGVGFLAQPTPEGGLSSPAKSSSRMVKEVQLAAPPSNPAIRARRHVTDPQQWAEEGRNLAIKYVYRDLREGALPGAGYRARALPVVKTQLALAGYRLADLLNGIYSSQSMSKAGIRKALTHKR